MALRFVLTGLLTAVVNLVAHALTYFLLLARVFAEYPGGSASLQQQLVKRDLVLWALGVSALAFGFLITTVVQWSGARNGAAGLRIGAIVGLLLWGGVNFGLYASSNNFSLVGTLADLICSSSCVTLSAGVAAAMLHRRHGSR